MQLSRALHALVASGDMNRREANHLQWEAEHPDDAIRKKGRLAVAQAVRRATPRKTTPPRVRNNRREY